MKIQNLILTVSTLLLMTQADLGQAQVLGPCGVPLPAEQARGAQFNQNLTCGELVIAFNRTYEPVDEKILSQWDVLLSSGRPGSREDMQKIRQRATKVTGATNVNVLESWSYLDAVTGANASRCGYQVIDTTCSRPVYRDVTVQESYCTAYAQDEPSGGGSSGSGAYSGGGYSGGAGSSSGGYGSGSSAGESSSSLGDRYDKHTSDDDSGFGGCISYGTRSVTKSEYAGTENYPCQKKVAATCTWDERRNTTRVCKSLPVKYQVEYVHDPKWVPGYQDSKFPERNYLDILPNKFDLLPGESEKVVAYINKGTNSTLAPELQIEQKWNEYRYKVGPGSQLKCSLTQPMVVHIDIDTVGRKKTKAPNFLSLPVDENGNKVDPLVFDSTGQAKGKPIRIKLQDNLRATYLAAARASRIFPEPQKEVVPGSTRHEFLIFGKRDDQAKNSNQIGFWAETQFRVQLFTRDRWNRWVRETLPMKFNSNKGDIFGDSIFISLEAKDGLERFYRPSGPLDGILGGLYKKFGVELTPRKNYYLKVQSAVKGLPFYESGCKIKGDDICEEQEPKDATYSEPVIIEFQIDKDQRSWFKKLKDWQERFLIF